MKLLKEIIHFLAVFLFLFTGFFVIMNYPAFFSMANYYFSTPEKKIIVESTPIKQAPLKLNLLSQKKIIKKKYPPLNLNITPTDYRLVIPKINKNIPIIKIPNKFMTEDLWGKFEKEVQEFLRKGVVHYPGTAAPGQIGNSFITGHSSYYPWDKGHYKEVFANLNQLEPGDEYFIYFQQKKYTYQVKEKKEVSPFAIKILEQSKVNKLSTLMTCWPLGTTLKRLIVVGEQV